MHKYALSYKEILDLPINVFWFMNSSIDRLRAEEGLRNIEVSLASQSSENYESVTQRLIIEAGSLFILDDVEPELDKAGLDELRMLV